jgi:hypothetical protein
MSEIPSSKRSSVPSEDCRVLKSWKLSIQIVWRSRNWIFQVIIFVSSSVWDKLKNSSFVDSFAFHMVNANNSFPVLVLPPWCRPLEIRICGKQFPISLRVCSFREKITRFHSAINTSFSDASGDSPSKLVQIYYAQEIGSWPLILCDQTGNWFLPDAYDVMNNYYPHE